MPELFLAALAALFLVAAACDIATMQIPNWISIVAAALFPVAAFVVGMAPLAIAMHLGIGAATLAGAFVLFHLRVFGGGDAKIIAAAGVWTGAAAFAPFALATAIAGGLLALVILFLRRIAKPGPTMPAFLNRLLDPAKGVPYAVAIAAGVLFALAEMPIAHASGIVQH
jgi:prepilin peptidase CpaA